MEWWVEVSREGAQEGAWGVQISLTSACCRRTASCRRRHTNCQMLRNSWIRNGLIR